jgi:hypothetical protein
MNCPNCLRELSVAHLRESAECSKALQSACGMYRLSKRITPPKAGPGRPKKAKPEGGVER